MPHLVDIKDLRVGSVVRLVSGSPKMAVTGLAEGGLIEVLWWSERLGILTDKIAVELLVYPRTAERDEIEAG
jgi:uncharacterized protein YodC (DUF2158 family)